MTGKEFTIGVDIVSINRFKNLDKIENRSLLNKIFTKNELEYCFSKVKAAPHLAARFAAKEAIIKAVKPLVNNDLNYNEIEGINDKNDSPLINILKKDLEIYKIDVSLSHSDDNAVAFVTLWSFQTVSYDEKS